MGCCGKKIQKIASIAEGNLRAADHFLRDLFTLPVEKYEYAEVRIRICQQCDFRTWMTKREYLTWLKANAKQVIVNIEDLEALPPLPIQAYKIGTKLVCSICKCWAVKKAYVKDAKCPKACHGWEI
jgi:hypothetical protein